MRTFATVVFSDLSGSAALYESLGNERASDTVTRLTQWIGAAVERHGGRVVKNLGDGVLSVFEDAAVAVKAAADIQRTHQRNGANCPDAVHMPVRIGVASGEIVERDGDTYGDAVNVAARLCERALAHEIWVTDSTAVDAGAVTGVRLRRLGAFDIRGKTGEQVIYQVEWRSDEPIGIRTQHAGLQSVPAPLGFGRTFVELLWAGEVHLFGVAQAPVQIGRSPDAQCHIHDPRVSRTHARIDWRQGAFVITDLSSFGSWVSFDASGAQVRLRRDACMLHGGGSISLGMPFGEGAPMLKFHVTGGLTPALQNL